LESIVVTAARVAQPAEEAVHPVTVITAEEIARSGQQSLLDVLQVFGGVEVSRNGGVGQLSSVFLRGANFNHTLVLVDGVRVASGYSETRGFSATKPTIPFDQFNPDDDGYRNRNVSAHILHAFGADHEIGVDLLHSQGRTWFDSGPETDDLTDERIESYSAHW